MAYIFPSLYEYVVQFNDRHSKLTSQLVSGILGCVLHFPELMHAKYGCSVRQEDICLPATVGEKHNQIRNV